jgi:hypothetical protein
VTVTIKFSPDIEADLLAQARAEGVGVADYVENLVRRQIMPEVNAVSSSEERLCLFHDWVKSHADNTVVLPDEAMERESIYGDHGR